MRFVSVEIKNMQVGSSIRRQVGSSKENDLRTIWKRTKVTYRDKFRHFRHDSIERLNFSCSWIKAMQLRAAIRVQTYEYDTSVGKGVRKLCIGHDQVWFSTKRRDAED